MAEDDDYPDDMPPVEEFLDEDDIETAEELAGGVEEKLLEGDDSVEGEPVEVFTGDGKVVVMPGADCTRCGSPSDGVLAVVGSASKWSGGQANPYCEECKEEMFPGNLGGGFDWREY